MPFKVETLPEQLISGFQTTLPTPASFNDISEMSIVKADYISKLKDIQDQVTEDAMDDDFTPSTSIKMRSSTTLWALEL